MDIDYLLPTPLLDNDDLQNLVDKELSSFLIYSTESAYNQKYSVNTYNQELKYEDVYVPAYIYVWAFYQAVESLIFLKGFEYGMEPILEDLIFKGRRGGFNYYALQYNTITGKLSVNNRPFFSPYEDIEKFYNFITGIHDNLLRKSILYFSFNFTYPSRSGEIISHANALILYKNPLTNEISMSIYEPGGSARNILSNKATVNIDSLLQYISTTYNIIYSSKGEKIVMINRREISCPEGIQTIMEHQSGIVTGYCVMFRYLWLYLLMMVIEASNNNIKANNILSIIKSIDTAVLRSKVLLTGSGSNPVENYKIKYTNLYKIMTNFSIYCYNLYISNLGKFSKPDDYTAFSRLFREAITTRLPGKFKPRLAILQPCKYSTECESNICLRDQDQEVGKCVLAEGENCQESVYCESGNCKEREVLAYDGNKRIIKKIRKCEPVLLEDGIGCSNDQQCASGSCSGTCQRVSLENGKKCNEDRYCQSGNCQYREIDLSNIMRQCEPMVNRSNWL